MRKRFVSLICAMALVLGMIIPGSNHVHAVSDTTCDCGATNVEWITLTEETVLAPGNHYRLAGDVDTGLIHLNTKEEAGTYCLDLAGHTLRSTNNRVFFIVKANDGDPIVVNIMDSSAQKTGRVVGFWGGPNNGAGVIYLQNGATMNVYGGTFTTANNTEVVAKSGGVFQINSGGTLNMYGGNIIGGTVVGNGGAVNVSGTLHMSGGSITAEGTAEKGNCIYAGGSADIRLSGDASIEEICFAGAPADSLTISGTYTGTVGLSADTAITSGTAVATLADNANISGATITAVGTNLQPSVSGTSLCMIEKYWCEACEDYFEWKNLSGALPANASGHYRLTKNVSADQVSISSSTDQTVCLDLAGYTYTGGKRALILGKSSGEEIVTVNIMDSSEDETGIIQAPGMGGAGGVIFLYNNAVFSLYSGTVQVTKKTSSVSNGGAIYNHQTNAEINIYGGKVIGGEITASGGTVRLKYSAVMNVTGGQIISGKAGGTGDCIYAETDTSIRLSGDADIDQIYFAGSSANKLTIDGEYTGNVELAYATAPASGVDVGNCINNAKIGKESITVANARLVARVNGANLETVALTGAAVEAVDGSVAYYNTLADAISAYGANSKSVRLLADNSETIALSKDVVLDLCGWDLTGAVTGTGKLCVMDSATDDCITSDVEGYGVIGSAVQCPVEAKDGYLLITENGNKSFHNIVLKLTKISLRPGNTGMYYTGDILLDDVVKGKLVRYGIAVSVETDEPSAQEGATTSRYTVITKENYSSGSTNSVLINAVMNQVAPQSENAVNAATTVYGRPYILLDDNTMFYGQTCATSLQGLTEAVDEKAFGSLSLPQNRALMAMYDQYKSTMGSWTIANISGSAQKAAEAAEDKVLKVLVIGNSHGLDATNLLYEVFHHEGIPAEYDNVILGAIYTGGCSVSTHASNALNDLRYDYWMKNDGTQENRAWVKTEDPTTREVLEDENWDIVLLQEMNTSSAREEYFTNDNIETVFTFVTNTLGYEPEFMWNMIWANPEIPESYVNYLYSNGDDGSGDNVGSGAEGDDNDTSEPAEIARRLAWIFQTQQPGALELWGKNYVKLWENNRQVMYNNIVSNVHNYVVGKSVHSIGMDDVMPNATAIQYAIEWMGMDEQDMYRDYTHVSDLGRLTVAYLWYAKLTGKTSIGAPKYTLVNQVLENSRQYLGYDKDYSQYSDVIKNSVNFALADHYGVIQNLTYAEYLALSADQQAAYEASFADFSVNSGVTFAQWKQAAIAGVTYKDYAGMTDTQKTDYQALRNDFATWYEGILEELTYAEYLTLTADQQTAYATARGGEFDAWLTAAMAAFTYSDYVMLNYEQQQAYQATFAAGEFDTHYEAWLADMTYDAFMALTMHQKVRFRVAKGGLAAFTTWYNSVKPA